MNLPRVPQRCQQLWRSNLAKFSMSPLYCLDSSTTRRSNKLSNTPNNRCNVLSSRTPLISRCLGHALASFAFYSIPFGAMMLSTSTQTAIQGGLLQIKTLKDLPQIISDLKSDTNLAKQLNGVEIKEKAELDADGNRPKVTPEDCEQIGVQVARIIQEIQQHSVLKDFTWIGVGPKNIRPIMFWEALCSASGKLNGLNLEFSTHELHVASKYTLPKLNLSRLTSLRIDADGAHGDDGSFVESILKSCDALETLDLRFPGCDLEACRIKGITWNYTFPFLQTLKISTYNSDNTALSDFLLRSPQIQVLEWSVDSDDGFIFPHDSLPALRDLSIDASYDDDLVKVNFKVLAKTSPLLEHLKTGHMPHASYLHIPQLGKSLKILKLAPGVCGWREGFGEPEEESDDEWNKRKQAQVNTLEKETGFKQLSQIITKMLAGLPLLGELDVDLETAYIYVNRGNPAPMDDADLISMLTLLPADGKIRVLRMSDSRAVALSDALLQEFPVIPKSLQILKWNMGEAENSEHERVYLLTRDGNKVKAVQQDVGSMDLGVLKI